MSNIFFAKGWLIGFSVAAAVGPISILCIQRAIAHGFKAGFFVGLGAACADCLYGAIAGAGLVEFANYLLHYINYISLAGGLFLFYLGIKTFHSRVTFSSDEKNNSSSLARIFFSSFILTLSNPLTILMFVAIFSSVGLINLSGSAFAMITGVFIGSLCWWLILSGGVAIARKKIPVKVLAAINRASAIMILSIACYAFLKMI